MKLHFDDFRFEPLPDDFSSAERTVDRHLSDAARQAPVRIGLSRRVFEASVDLLPRAARPAPTLAGPWSWNRLVWSRLALAACLVIVGTLAVRFLPHNATRWPELDAAPLDELALMFGDESTGQIDSDFAYLLDTHDLTSPDEITGELAMLVSDLGM